MLDWMPYWQAAHDLMTIFLIFGRQQIPPKPQIHLYPLLDMLDKAVYAQGRPGGIFNVRKNDNLRIMKM
jgi:hypothetical protein